MLALSATQVTGTAIFLNGTAIPIGGSATITAGTGGGGVTQLTTKGDLLSFGTALDRLGVGSNGQVLTAQSTAALGIVWAAAPSAGSGATLINTDGDPGATIYVGSIDPDVGYSPAVGDVWIRTA